MYRILLLSDTHGRLDLINEKACLVRADFVIHAGDFGFYDRESTIRLSSRELRLLITHSPFRNQYPNVKHTDGQRLAEIVKEHKLLGEFSDYLSGEKNFDVPVYAVWGNHEDTQVLKNLRTGPVIHNLHILDENNVYEFKHKDALAFSLYGIGGNFLPGDKLFDGPLSGSGGKVWSTLHQFGILYKKLYDKEKPSIFVSHVSPGKESLLVRLMIHFMPNFWVSGHMGSPYPCVWNQFAIRESDETLAWLESNLSMIEQQRKVGRISEEASLALELMRQPVSNENFLLRQMWNINLPDAKDGHAVLIFDNGRFALETFSNGMVPISPR